MDLATPISRYTPSPRSFPETLPVWWENANSKRLFALIIFAGVTIAVALLLRPDADQAFTRLFHDIFAMLISAVIIFLSVNVWTCTTSGPSGRCNGGRTPKITWCGSVTWNVA